MIGVMAGLFGVGALSAIVGGAYMVLHEVGTLRLLGLIPLAGGFAILAIVWRLLKDARPASNRC